MIVIVDPAGQAADARAPWAKAMPPSWQYFTRLRKRRLFLHAGQLDVATRDETRAGNLQDPSPFIGLARARRFSFFSAKPMVKA